MSGAYTAKPEDVVSLDLPPGWNLTWPFPGPFPPGYEPDLLLGLAAPATVYYTTGLVGGVTTSLTDQVTYGTAEPGDQLLWTATLLSDGLAVGLKLRGEGSFANALRMDYAEISELWGSLSDIVFDIDESDGGDTIRLQVSSTPFDGYPVNATADIVIAINVPEISVIFTVTWEPQLAAEVLWLWPWAAGGGLSGPADIEREIWGEAPPPHDHINMGGDFTYDLPSDQSVRIFGENIAENSHVNFDIFIQTSILAGTATLKAELLYDGEVVAEEVTLRHTDWSIWLNTFSQYQEWADIDVAARTISLQSVEEFEGTWAYWPPLAGPGHTHT